MMDILLASASSIRASLLRNAGLEFDVVVSEIDERALEMPIIQAGSPPQDLAVFLAQAKALDVSARNPDHVVIGCDQVLTFAGARMIKPANMTAARRQLLDLSGQTHTLHAAICCARAGRIDWQYEETAWLTMRHLTSAFIGRYLARAGPEVLHSVGVYQLERLGVQLFDKIEGDYFTILGLPLLPLLRYLRQSKVIE
jgi:septum formation protein